MLQTIAALQLEAVILGFIRNEDEPMDAATATSTLVLTLHYHPAQHRAIGLRWFARGHSLLVSQYQ
jgi:hypothetical protein